MFESITILTSWSDKITSTFETNISYKKQVYSHMSMQHFSKSLIQSQETEACCLFKCSALSRR